MQPPASSPYAPKACRKLSRQYAPRSFSYGFNSLKHSRNDRMASFRILYLCQALTVDLTSGLPSACLITCSVTRRLTLPSPQVDVALSTNCKASIIVGRHLFRTHDRIAGAPVDDPNSHLDFCARSYTHEHTSCYGILDPLGIRPAEDRDPSSILMAVQTHILSVGE